MFLPYSIGCMYQSYLESIDSSDSKEIKPVNLKGNQPWIFIGRTDAETEAPILWPPDVKSQLIGKDPDAGKDGRQEEKGMTEDEMVGWHHWFNGHGFEWTLGVGDGQGGLVCCKESDTTEHLNWTDERNQRRNNCYPLFSMLWLYQCFPFSTIDLMQIPIKIPANTELILKSIWSGKRPRIGDRILENRIGRPALCDSQIYYKDTVIKRVWHLWKKLNR